MIYFLGKKEIVLGGVVFLVLFLMVGILQPLHAVTTEECMEAYEECMQDYGSLPFPMRGYGSLYCATGLSFCILFM